MNEQVLNELREERHADAVAREAAAKVNKDCVASIVGGGNAAFENNYREAERAGWFIDCVTIGDYCMAYVKYLQESLSTVYKPELGGVPQ